MKRQIKNVIANNGTNRCNTKVYNRFTPNIDSADDYQSECKDNNFSATAPTMRSEIGTEPMGMILKYCQNAGGGFEDAYLFSIFAFVFLCT